MTNVPDSLREMWADIYRLFDMNYKMENTEQAWEKFWKQARELNEKYKSERLIRMITVVSEMIEDRIEQDAENDRLKGQESHPHTYEDINLF